MHLQLRVKPNSRQARLEQGADGAWVAHLKAPPVEGKANRELIAMLAEHFGCSKGAVTIKAGASGRMKLVHIAD